jgi:hypothetical protein
MGLWVSFAMQKSCAAYDGLGQKRRSPRRNIGVSFNLN